MIFVTVGTVFPFDRLVRAVDEAAGRDELTESVFAQVGRKGYRPRHLEWAETIDRRAFAERMADASAVVAHAGTGTIFAALEAGRPILVMPRRKSLREHVNDHQVHTARRFGALGHVLVAWDETEIPEKLRELRTFVPRPRVPNREPVVECVRAFLEQVSNGKRSADFAD